MSLHLNIEKLQKAFPDRADIQGAIQSAAAAPEWIELFNIINGYVAGLQDSLTIAEPASKKRKLDDALTHNPAAHVSSSNGTSGKHVTTWESDVQVDETALLHIKDISVVLPQRKKYTIEFTPTHIRARNPSNNELVPGISYAWQDVAYAFCLPVPEKTAKQYNYIIFPRSSYLPSKSTPASVDPLIFTIPAAAPKPNSISGSLSSQASSYSDTHKDVFDWAIRARLKDVGSLVSIEEPTEKQFASTIKEAHRPSEKAMFVKGFRGSKDGYLFFMSTGILWAFKKPVLFIPKSQVVAVSYTSVLQRTFNLNVEVALSHERSAAEPGEDEEEFEFAMLDQEDFDGIDTYIKRHGLQDKSMAEQRKAKRLGVNDVKGEDGKMVEAEDGGALEAAQLELDGMQDEDEDSEGEDYDPGSEGESEGSGTSSEEDSEDDAGGGEEGDDDDDDDVEGGDDNK